VRKGKGKREERGKKREGGQANTKFPSHPVEKKGKEVKDFFQG